LDLAVKIVYVLEVDERKIQNCRAAPKGQPFNHFFLVKWNYYRHEPMERFLYLLNIHGSIVLQMDLKDDVSPNQVARVINDAVNRVDDRSGLSMRMTPKFPFQIFDQDHHLRFHSTDLLFTLPFKTPSQSVKNIPLFYIEVDLW